MWHFNKVKNVLVFCESSVWVRVGNPQYMLETKDTLKYLVTSETFFTNFTLFLIPGLLLFKYLQ